MSKFLPHNEHLRRALIFVFIRRKVLLDHTDYFEKLMVNVFHREIHVNDGFGVSEVVTSTQDNKKDNDHGKPPKIRIYGIASIVASFVFGEASSILCHGTKWQNDFEDANG